MAIQVRFQSLTGRRYKLYVLADPSLSNNGDDDSGNCSNSALVAHDKQSAAALITRPALAAGSCGFKGTSDGWTDLSAHKRMLWHYASAPNGNVFQTARTKLDGSGVIAPTRRAEVTKRLSIVNEQRTTEAKQKAIEEMERALGSAPKSP